VKTISKEVSKGQQSMHYVEVLRLEGGAMVRVSILSDYYDHQSHAHIEVLDRPEHQWNFLHRIPCGNMKTPPKLAFSPTGALAHHYMADRVELLRVAQELLE
jgi:hypothetical protein